MPSPFPGMDPYLEGSRWTSFHAQLGSEISRQLAPKVRPRYTAMTVQRFVLEEPDDVSIATSSIYPDVAVSDQGGESPSSQATSAIAPIRLATAMAERVPNFAVEIRDAENRQLVTAIEILSPSNKRGEGREQYLHKRQRILLSSAHLVEIDLLRRGDRLPIRGDLPDAAYYVFVNRQQQRHITDIWPISIRDSLPEIPIPLLEPDADVMLDLQLTLQTIYDAVGYDLAVNYAVPPDVPLSDADVHWAVDQINSAKANHS